MHRESGKRCEMLGHHARLVSTSLYLICAHPVKPMYLDTYFMLGNKQQKVPCLWSVLQHAACNIVQLRDVCVLSTFFQSRPDMIHQTSNNNFEMNAVHVHARDEFFF